MADDSRNAEEVNSVTIPHENRTPTVGVRQEQPEAPTWAIGIQQALEKLIEVTAKNVAPDRNQRDESYQNQSQMQVSEPEQGKQRSPSPHPQDRLRIIHEFLKLKPPRYDNVDYAVDPYQFMDQIERIGKMLGCSKNMLIELVRFQLDDVAHYWYVQHVEKRPTNVMPLTRE